MSISDHVHHPDLVQDLLPRTQIHCSLVAVINQQIHLLDLPGELLTEIVGGLETTCDLAACARTCKRLLESVEPALYSTFNRGKAHRGHDENAATDIKLFLLTLLHRPELARHVKKINVGNVQCTVNTGNDRSLLELEVFTHSERELIRQVLENLNGASEDLYMDAFEGRHAEAFVAILLALVPNLEEYSFTTTGEPTPLIDGVIDMGLEGIVLGKLRKVSMIYYDTEGGLKFDHYTTLMQLPSLRELHAAIVDTSSDSWLFPTGSSHVENICVYDGCFSLETLRTLLVACKKVTMFTYRAGGYIHGDHQFEPDELISELEKTHLETLQSLTLDFEHHNCAEDSTPIGDLSIFPNLQHLSIRQNELIGRNDDHVVDENDAMLMLVDVLPESLEACEFTGCDGRIFGRLVDLAAKRDRFPSLEKINVIMDKGRQRSEDEEALGRVKEAFGMEEGLHIRFVQRDQEVGSFVKW